MASHEGGSGSTVRYQPDERPPWPLAVGHGRLRLIADLPARIGQCAERQPVEIRNALRKVYPCRTAVPLA